MEIKITKDNKGCLIPWLIVFLLTAGATYYYKNVKKAEADRKVRTAIEQLKSENLKDISRGILKLYEVGFPARKSIDHLLKFLGDRRVVPLDILEESRLYKNTKLKFYNNKDIYTLGKCAAFALGSINNGYIHKSEGVIPSREEKEQQKDKDKIIDSILRILENGEEARVLDGLFLLKFCNDERTLAPVSKLLYSTSNDIRVAALTTFFAYTNRSALKKYRPIFRRLAKDDNQEIRFYAKELLKKKTDKNF